MESVEEKRDPSAFLAAVVPVGLKRDLVALAHQHERSVSAEVRVAVRAHLEREQERNT